MFWMHNGSQHKGQNMITPATTHSAVVPLDFVCVRVWTFPLLHLGQYVNTTGFLESIGT
jgi:hypothetical protein